MRARKSLFPLIVFAALGAGAGCTSPSTETKTADATASSDSVGDMASDAKSGDQGVISDSAVGDTVASSDAAVPKDTAAPHDIASPKDTAGQTDTAGPIDTAGPNDTTAPTGDCSIVQATAIANAPVGDPKKYRLVFTHFDPKTKEAAVHSLHPDGVGLKILPGLMFVLSQPRAGRLVGLYGTKGKFVMRVVDADGSVVSEISDSLQPVFGTLSADGKFLAWTRRLDSNNTKLLVRNLATGAEHELPQSPSWETRPEFSPDGNSLAFYGDAGELFIADGQGIAAQSVLTNLVDDNDYLNGLAWTSDSKALVVTAANPNSAGLTDIVKLAWPAGGVSHVSCSQGVLLAPALAADGNSVWFMVIKKGQGAAIRQVALQGGPETQLTDGATFEVLPQPSPDNAWVAYGRWTLDDNLGELRVMSLATGAVKVLDEAAYNRAYWVAAVD